MKPAGAVSICGEVSDRIMAGIRLAVRDPGAGADTLPYELQFAELDAVGNAALTVAEAAAVRWLEVYRAPPNGRAAHLCWELQQLRRAAVAFDPDGRALAEVARLVGDLDTACIQATCLARRVYLVPFGRWTPQLAAAICSDVRREREAGFPLHGFVRCAEREELRRLHEAAP